MCSRTQITRFSAISSGYPDNQVAAQIECLWVVERLFALLTYRNRMVAGAEIPIDSSTH